MYYIEKENKIVLFDEDKQKLQDTLTLMPQYKDLEIKEVREGYTIVDFELMTIEQAEEKAEQKERERILELRMTPLDFLKAIEQYGITYDMVKQFMEQNPLVERELRFCQFVYRKHPMLQSLSEYGITSGVLDTIFRKANGEDV